MLQIIGVAIVAFVITYKAFYVVNYINEKDNTNIKNNLIIKFILSLIVSLEQVLLYIKYKDLVYIAPAFIALVFITVMAYIDFYTKYIYGIISKPLLIFSVFMFLFNIIGRNITTKEISMVFIISIIFYIFGKLRYIGEGDVEVIIALLLLFSNSLFFVVALIFFSFGVSGIAGIYLLIFKKVGLNHRKPFMPSLALAMYLILFTY
jgi:leader peptidase (prepilin peptidase)/N-methyltransferase